MPQLSEVLQYIYFNTRAMSENVKPCKNDVHNWYVFLHILLYYRGSVDSCCARLEELRFMVDVNRSYPR